MMLPIKYFVDISKSFSWWTWNAWYEYGLLERQTMLLSVNSTDCNCQCLFIENCSSFIYPFIFHKLVHMISFWLLYYSKCFHLNILKFKCFTGWSNSVCWEAWVCFWCCFEWRGYKWWGN